MTIPPIVEPEWYEAHADEVVLVDVRWYADGRDGRDAYRAGHIPGAIWISVDDDLSAQPVPGGARHPLPQPIDFASALGAVGIPEGATVVAYDDASGSYAARLVWLLRTIGEDAAVLSGGLPAWRGPVESGEFLRTPVHRDSVPWPAERFTPLDTLAAGGGAAGIDGALVDARAADRFAGTVGSPLDPRAGHIPGAVSVPWASNMTASGRFKGAQELADLYRSAGIDLSGPVTAYCGSGVTACTDLLALEHAGATDVRLYPGSWSEWGGDASLPVETGQAPASASASA